MRFAYIDSQGKEVPIPSVDALQLRIELGAITAETMFFDGNTEKWAPAEEHEIFRTLSRELKDDDEEGFVAPPPPTMVQARPPGTPEAGAPAEEASDEAEPPEGPSPETPREPAGETPETPAEVPEADAPPPEAPEEAPTEPPKRKAPDPFAMEAGPAEAEEPAGADDEDADLSDFGQIDLGPASSPASDMEEFGPSADAGDFGDLGSFDLVGEEEEEEDEPEYEGDESFDFGDFGEGHLKEGRPDSEEAEEAEELDEEEETPTFEFEGELELEDTGLEEEEEDEEEDEESEAAADAAPEASSGLELEAPLSEYSPDRPPSWMDEEEEEEGFDLAGYQDEEEEDQEEAPSRRAAPASSGEPGGEEGGDDDGDGEEPAGRRERPAPRARPERPRKKKSGAGSVAVGVIALAVLGGGGWFGWNALQNRESEPVEEVVEIPELASSLQPTLEAAAGPAYQATVDSLRALGADLPAAPDEDWLSGRYLANASQFESIAEYWEGFQQLLETARQRGPEIFVAEFEARLDSLGVTGADRTALVERASAGYRAARADRVVVFNRLEALVDASLSLHDFLVGNEDAIEYSPVASGVSADPVTEARPANEALGEEMWDRVRAITRALDDLGALEERVGTERLLDTVFGQIREMGIR